jgi:hypothetical protein
MSKCAFCRYGNRAVDHQPCADCFRRAWEENDCWPYFEPDDDVDDDCWPEDLLDLGFKRLRRRKGAMRRWVR